LEAAAAVFEKILIDYVAKIADKFTKGERLTHSEATILFIALTQRDVSRLGRRIEEVKQSVDQVKGDLERKMDTGFAEVQKRIDDTNTRINEFKEDVNRRFNETNTKIDDTNKRIDDFRLYVDKRFEITDDNVDNGFRELSERIDVTNKRIEETSKRIDNTDKKVEDLRVEVSEEAQRVKEDLSKKIDEVKSDTVYLKQSLDQLRDNVVTTLVEKLKKE